KTVTHYTEAGPGPKGSVMTICFELDGSEFLALNGGPDFKFTEAISLVVNTNSQEELDNLWNKLIADGGQPSHCGWLKDKFGLSWQIVPSRLGEWLSGDGRKVQKMQEVLFKMDKLDIATLEKAYEEA
ncbi:MAG: VOC family protein, partial [Niastella sp.]|uniref:VOC family protein n=1 Tax=Niastella sp. TaxID=1869183 RepID=UPI00389B366D